MNQQQMASFLKFSFLKSRVLLYVLPFPKVPGDILIDGPVSTVVSTVGTDVLNFGKER